MQAISLRARDGLEQFIPMRGWIERFEATVSPIEELSCR
jgi:hypothetical protein